MSCLLREVWGAKMEPATYALGEVGSVCLSCAVQDLEWQCGDRSLAHLIPGRWDGCGMPMLSMEGD